MAKQKKYAIRNCLGQIHSENEYITDKMRFNIQVNPLSEIVRRSQSRWARKGWIAIEEETR
jgi:hypothetical protein